VPNQTNRHLLIVIPCRNEQGRIGEVVRSVNATMPEADVAVIDDASSDDSAYQAESAGATVLTHAVHLGYGTALETGYLYAMERGYETVLQMDGDGQHLAEELPALLAPLKSGEADLVIGSRHLGPTAYDGTLLTRLGQRFFSAIVSPLVGQRLTDPTSGFQGIGKKALSRFAGGDFPCDYPDADVILMASLSGLRVVEVPTRMKPRVAGKSMHSGLRPVYYGIKMLLSMFVVLLNYGTWKELRRRN
jgi:hypothetical protein